MPIPVTIGAKIAKTGGYIRHVTIYTNDTFGDYQVGERIVIRSMYYLWYCTLHMYYILLSYISL